MTLYFCFSAHPRPLHSETLGPPRTASVAPHRQTACVSREAQRAAAPSTAASCESAVQPPTTDPRPLPPSPTMQHRSHSHAAVGQPTSSPSSPPSSHAGKQSTSLYDTSCVTLQDERHDTQLQWAMGSNLWKWTSPDKPLVTTINPNGLVFPLLLPSSILLLCRLMQNTCYFLFAVFSRL